MNSLAFNIPILHRHSNYLIKLVHHKLEIEKDMEMRASIELQFWTNNDGEFGEPVLQVIANDSELTARQKANDMEVFRTRIWSSTTRGSWCNPTTGALVYPDNSGNYPEGSVTQLTFWQSLPHGAFAGTTLAEKVYAALLVNMQQIYDLDNI